MLLGIYAEAVVGRCFIKKVFLEISQNLHLCKSLFFNKVAGPRPATLLKKTLWQRCFPVNFVKFLRAPFCIEHLWWLLLYMQEMVFNDYPFHIIRDGLESVLIRSAKIPMTNLPT